jgi:hypothetical protein
MITGLVIARHVHLTAIARATHDDTISLHAHEKSLSLHLASEHWDASPVAAELLRRSAAMVTDDSLIVADTTDLSKPYAKHLEGLGRVHDGSDPEGRTTPGYCLFEAYVRVGSWQHFPLKIEPLKTYSGGPTSENAEFLQHILSVHQATGGKGTWILDRGFDRRKLFGPLVTQGVAFVVRQRGDRNVRTADGRTLTVKALVAEQTCPQPKRWPKGGVTVTLEVTLPEVGPEPFLLVIAWKVPKSERPLILLASPAARRARRNGGWYVKAYGKRWGVEDATRGLKQQFSLEGFLVRSWMSLRRLGWLVAWAFWWLNLWGDESFRQEREVLMNHPWRLKKPVMYLFNWIAKMLREVLHPPARIQKPSG